MASIWDWFNSPAVLGLLLLLPVLWVLSFRSLSGLGRVRRLAVLVLRSVVFVAIVLALADMQYLRKSDRMTVIYLLDQSASIPQEQRAAMVQFVKRAVMAHRDDDRRDRAALIVFGRDATVEVPPVEAQLPVMGTELESIFDLETDATNLAAAMKMAQALFPEDSTRRIVVVTDGNENIGDARAVARLLAEDGVGIDVVPVRLGDQPEVAVERVTLPADIRKGQPFSARVVVQNIAPPTLRDRTVHGTIRLLRRMGPGVETLSEQPVELPAGKSVFSFEDTIDMPDFYEYEAQFVPDDPNRDLLAQNNRATAYTQVLGQGHILLIEDMDARGQFDVLIDHLRRTNLQVTVQTTEELFASLAELQRYDAIILANVPRSSGGEEAVSGFSDDQVQMLVRNTHDMGCGLIMLGGESSFGAGGWANSELEKAMPVDFQIHNAKVVPVGALAMVMHASEMAQGNYWQKKIAEEALKALGPQDYCGIVHWNGREEWLWGLPYGLVKVGPNKPNMIARLSRMTPGDMPDFDPSLKMSAAAFSRLQDASVKHMIVISDGDPSPASNGVLTAFRTLKVPITTVAVGAHGPAGHQELQRIARATGGKYYVVNNPNTLPRIYQREARRVARPLVKEGLFPPRIRSRHEILQGIDQSPPPITGFVLTTVKQNPLVEVLLVSPDPPDESNATLLAAWTYGLGRTAVLTTDAGHRWATRWTGWEGYDKLFSQLVRWCMRPTGDQGKFHVATEIKDGQVHLVVTALDENDELRNFLNIAGSVVAPDMSTRDVPLRQVAPGRYVGQFEGRQAGSYFITLAPGPGQAPIRTGVNVPYSDEYRDRETNQALLEQLVSLKPQGGKPGVLISGDVRPGQLDSLLQVNSFRRDLAPVISSREIWPLLVLAAACVFFADVFVRRVSVSFDWVAPVWSRVASVVLRRQAQPVADQRLERLRMRKIEVGQQLVERRAATRFQPEPDAAVDTAALEAAAESRPAPSAQRTVRPITPTEAEEEDYTSRLLKAKRQVWEDRH